MGSFNETTRWSRLARLGNSPLARLTIVTPFLGFVIFLNTGLDDYLELGPTVLSDSWLNYFADRRVELLYVGLTILGAATGLFAFFAPDTIKSSLQYSDFIQFKENTKTSNAVVGSFEKTIDTVAGRLLHQAADSFWDIPTGADFPESVLQSLDRLVISVFEGGAEASLLNATELEADQELLPEYYTVQGWPNIDPIFESLVARRRVDQYIWKSIFAGLPEFSIDVFRLEYLIKDYSQPFLRGFVFSAFFLGSFVALVPTLTSIWMVLIYSF